jgi:hypothetical protein
MSVSASDPDRTPGVGLAAFRTLPHVREAMCRWWVCLRKTSNLTITKQVYCLMLSKLCVLLLKETWTDAQLDAQVR